MKTCVFCITNTTRNMKRIFILIILVNIFTTYCFAETVIFNTKTHKYHKPGCIWAIKCTVNCIKLEKKDAVKHGGIPCKVCGG